MTFILSLKSLFKRKDAEQRLQAQNGGCISVVLELPVELWIEILSFIPDQRTLARVMQVNHTFHDLAGRALYQTVTMKGDRAAALFNRSLELWPGREQSVTQLDVTELQFGHKHAFLSALSNLRYLTIMCSSPHGTWLRSCNYILAMRFPVLRGFTTNLPISTMDHLDTFLAAHDHLDELDLAHSYFVHDSGFEDFTPCPSKLFTSVRILGYHSPFIDQKMATSTSITHLYRPTCSPVELHLIASLRQLVSLRLGPNFGGWRAQWSLHTVTEVFPRLRFLQVDTIQGDVPELNTDVVDWTKSRGDVPRRPSSALRLTVAWTFSGALKSSLYSVAWADAWEDYLEAAALQVLRTWGDAVKRVIYRHTEIPTTTLTLPSSGNIYTSSVIDRREDHWKRV